MSKILAIALNTFREAVRNRILYIILIFALLLLVFSGVLRNFTITDDERLVQNFGMSAINFFGLMIAIFIGITLIYNEMEKKTLYTIISKPIDRSQFLLGKYFGLLLTIYVNVLIMTLFFLVAMHWQHWTEYDVMRSQIWTYKGEEAVLRMPVWVYYLKAAFMSLVQGAGSFFLGLYAPNPDYTKYIMATTWMTCVELAVITAFACMYSTFSTPTLSAIFTLMTVIVGRLNEDIYNFARMMVQKKGSYELLEQSEKAWYWLALTIFHVSPNLGLFNCRDSVIYPDSSPWNLMAAYSISYGFAYSALILAIAILVFRRRNFK